MNHEVDRTDTQRIIRPAIIAPLVELSSLSLEEQALFAIGLQATWRALNLGDTET